jgi:branched-chain amino acid transport system ATP-binding protein
MLEITNLWAGYDQLDILRGVELSVPKGTITCIVGPNGAGKSTVLKTISGLLKAKRGTVSVAEREITRCSPTQVLQAGVVQVPQRFGLFTTLSVRDNVLMGGYIVRRQKGRLANRYAELAKTFPLLAERPDVAAGALSGGQRRVVEFARAMMLEPQVVLLDEPTLGLDPRSLGIIGDSIAAMRGDGTTVLMVEQNVRFGLKLADVGVVMSAGEVVATAPAAELTDEARLVELFFSRHEETA